MEHVKTYVKHLGLQNVPNLIMSVPQLMMGQPMSVSQFVMTQTHVMSVLSVLTRFVSHRPHAPPQWIVPMVKNAKQMGIVVQRIHVRYVLLGNIVAHFPITNAWNAMPTYIVMMATSVTVLTISMTLRITLVNPSIHVMTMVVTHVHHHLQFVKITTFPPHPPHVIPHAVKPTHVHSHKLV